VTSITGVVTDGTSVYWMGAFSNGDGTTGEIFSCLGTGCNKSGTLLTSTPGPGQLVTAAGSMFWPTNAPGSAGHHTLGIQTCKFGSCSSGTPVTSASGGVGGLATDGSTLYWWPAATSVEFCDVASCTPTQFDTATSGTALPYTIAVGNSHVYWIDSGNVFFCDALEVACTNATNTNSTTGATVVTADGNNVYWADSSGVKQCAGGFPGCKTGNALTLAAGSQSATSIISDGTYVYWTTSSSTIGRATIGVANSGKIIAQNQAGAANIAVGSAGVYWNTGTIVMALAK
jgi:hypothetical protein